MVRQSFDVDGFACQWVASSGLVLMVVLMMLLVAMSASVVALVPAAASVPAAALVPAVASVPVAVLVEEDVWPSGISILYWGQAPPIVYNLVRKWYVYQMFRFSWTI